MTSLQRHHLLAPLPTVDIRLVPAGITAWTTALVVTGQWFTAPLESQNWWSTWGVAGAVALGVGATGALLSALVCLRALRPDTQGRPLTKHWCHPFWSQAIPSAVLCVLISGTVAVCAVDQQVTEHQAVTMSMTTESAPEVAASHSPGAAYRIRLTVTDRPVPWHASASADVTSWTRGSGEAASGVVVPVRGDGFSATVFAENPQWRQLRAGDRVTAVVTRSPESGGEIVLRSASPPEVVGRDEPTGLMGWVETSTTRFMADALNRGPEAASLLPGMTYGDRSGFDPALEQAMKDTGLTHLTAVSGSNCALVMILTGHMVLSFGAGRKTCITVGLFALGLFVVLVGPDASVLRAAVMGLVAAIGVLAGRGGASLAALSVAVCGLLIVDPGWGRDFGFALSVCATAGIVVTGRPLIRILTCRLPPFLATAIAIPVVAQLWCAAVLTLLTPSVPVFSVLANAVVAPAVPVITVLGLLALLCFGQPVAVGHVVGQALLNLGELPVTFVATTARFFAGLPAAVLPWWSPPLGPFVMALICLVMILAVHRWDARLTRRLTSGMVDTTPVALSVPEDYWHRVRRRQRWITVGSWTVALACVVIFVAGLFVKPAIREDWMALMCDVGQGDALLIRGSTGEKTNTVLIDTGPDPTAVQRCLKDAGVTNLDLLILSHDHADHVAGAAGLDRHVHIEHVWWSTGTGKPPHEISAWDTPSNTPSPGTVLETETMKIDVLAASTRPSMRVDSSGENNASLAVRIQLLGNRDFPTTTVFSAGDLEEGGADRLLREYGDQPGGPLDADVLKVSHHGAANGGTAIVDATSPAVALISVGADNSYGHPSPRITSHLSAAGIMVARTDQLGAIGLYPDYTRQELEVRSLR